MKAERVPPAPLTEAQKERAGRHPACLVPWAAAGRLSRRRPWLFGLALPLCVDAYVRLAAKFDPAKNHMGEAGWPPYAAHWVPLMALGRMKQRAASARGRGEARTASLEFLRGCAGPGIGLACRPLRGRAPEDPLEAASARDFVEQALSRLPAMWRLAVRLRLGGATLEEAGAAIGRTKERVRQIEEKAYPRLREWALAQER